jgi:hypothetical protein
LKFEILNLPKMENNRINQKIDAAMSSLDGIKRAEVGDALFDSILHQLDEKKINVTTLVPIRTVWLAAASFALIVALNAVLLVQNARYTEGSPSAAASAIAQTYFNQNP